MTEYAGQQFVGIDLHRRRSVLVRTTESGEVLEAIRILNDVDRLERVMARAGEDPEVVLEATYGWYWAVDALQEFGCAGASGASAGGEGVRVPPGQERRAGRRPTWPTCCGWAGCRRRGSRRRPPGSCASWSGTGPSWSGCASHCKAEIHAVLAKCGIQVLMSDLFSLAGDRAARPGPAAGAPTRRGCSRCAG